MDFTLRPNPRARPRPHTFRAAKENALCVAIARAMLPHQTRRKLKVTQIDVSDEAVERLRALKGERVMLTPSHSGGFEPNIVMALARRIGEWFNFVAAMEVFERSAIEGWFLQRIGVYSIIRGTADRQSFKMTKQLLVNANRWLVIFPEGQTVWQNDMVMPFQQGVFQLAFSALEEAAKSEDGASLYCVPIAIKYVYLQDMTSEIASALDHLETKLFAHERPGRMSVYERMRRVGEAVLVANEKKYGIEPGDDVSLDDRIQQMKEKIVSSLEQRLEIKPRAGEALLDRIRTLFNTVDRIVAEEPAATAYQRDLQLERHIEAQLQYEDLWRVMQLVAIYDGYVRELMTVERLLDIIGLLEMEVLRKRPMRGPRKALVEVGEPIDLAHHRADYREDRKRTVGDVTLALETSVREMLESFATHCRPLVPDAGPS